MHSSYPAAGGNSHDASCCKRVLHLNPLNEHKHAYKLHLVSLVRAGDPSLGRPSLTAIKMFAPPLAAGKCADFVLKVCASVRGGGGAA